MKSRFNILEVRTPADLPALTELFRAYAASLPIDLGYQGFDGELAALPGQYAPPAGALLIARDANGATLGCVAMRPLLASPQGEGVAQSATDLRRAEAASAAQAGGAATPACEMKRLYVAPEGRGAGVGKALVQAIIETARARGYSELCLDTLPAMSEAQALYKSLGFTEMAAYYATPIEGTVFMSLKLR